MANVKAAMEYAASLDREAREKRLSEFTYDSLGPSYKHVPYPPDPPKEWVGLTDEEISELMDTYDVASTDYAQAIEAKLKEKNR